MCRERIRGIGFGGTDENGWQVTGSSRKRVNNFGRVGSGRVTGQFVWPGSIFADSRIICQRWAEICFGYTRICMDAVIENVGVGVYVLGAGETWATTAPPAG